MKKVIFGFLTALFFVGNSQAQAPEAMNYQAVARDGSGFLISSQILNVRVGVYSGIGGATLEYEETHSVSTNQYGQFSLKIGTGTATSGLFSDIVWALDEHHLKVEVDAGSGYVDLGTTQMVSVPYALHAATADVAGPWELNTTNAYYNNGFVGIGTDTPNQRLHVHTPGGVNYIQVSDGTTGPTAGLRVGVNGSGNGFLLNDHPTGNLFLTTNGSNRIAITHDGLVGIGTNSPDYPLQLHASSGFSYMRFSDAVTGTSSGLRVGLSGTGDAYIINDESLKDLSLGTEGTTRMRIDANGNVGINETTPEQVLHIKQTVSNKGLRIEHNSTADYWENGVGVTTKNYKFYYNNIFRADISSVDGSYTQSSDRRLKKNITYMESVLDRVMLLKPATYNYIDNDDDAVRSTGFVAQEVQTVFPNLVRDMDGGYKGVVYDGFAVISIRAIQELNTQLQELQAELDALKAELNK
jgi:hypothetical protein